MQRSKPTIYDIAREAGISPSSVSRALRHAGHVGSDTEDRIRAIAERLGYTKLNEKRMRRPNLVAIVASNIRDRQAMSFIESVQRRLASRNYSTLIIEEAFTLTQRDGFRADFSHSGFDGAIVAAVNASEEEILALASHLPTIPVNRIIPGLPSANIQPDDAIALAMRTLAQTGHHSVTYLLDIAPSPLHSRITECLRTQAADLGIQFTVLPGCPSTFKDGHGIFTRFARNATDAVFASTLEIASGFCLAARQANWTIPEQVSVIAFGDESLDGIINPPISLITMPFEQLGTACAETLVSMIQTNRHRAAQAVDRRSAFIDRGSVAHRRREQHRSVQPIDSATGLTSVKEPMTLTVMAASFQDWDDRITLYEQSHANISIQRIIALDQTSTITEYWKRLRSGKDIPDILVAEYRYLPQLVDEGGLRDISSPALSETLHQQLLPSCWDAVHYRGGLYGIPADHDTLVMFYRKDILGQFGFEPPRTWNEMYRQFQSIQRKHPGCAMTTLNTANSAHLVALLYAAQAIPWHIQEQESRIELHLTSEATMNAMTLLQQGIDMGAILSIQSNNSPESIAAMREGRLATIVQANWLAGSITKYCPEVQGLWAITMPPSFTDSANIISAPVGGSAFTISNWIPSKKIRAAAQFALWMQVSPKALKALPSWTMAATASAHRNPVIEQRIDPYFEQQTYHTFFESAELVTGSYQHFPFVIPLETGFHEEVVPYLVPGGDAPAHMERWQSQLAAYARSRGYEVVVD